MEREIILLGLDDTDSADRGGTGRLARELGALLAGRLGGARWEVTRHRLLQDPRVPCTRKNQASCVALQAPGGRFASLLPSLAQEVRRGAIPGSDPGICAAGPQRVTPAILAFGRRVQRTLVKREEALALAAEAGIHLEALGGTGDGVIGALAAVALRASGADGRFTALGRIRDLRGILPVSDLLAAGPIARVCDRAGRALAPEALVDTGGKVRPWLRDGEPVLVVAPGADRLWRPVRLA